MLFFRCVDLSRHVPNRPIERLIPRTRATDVADWADPFQRELKKKERVKQLSSSLTLVLPVVFSVTPEFQHTHRVQGLVSSQEQ